MSLNINSAKIIFIDGDVTGDGVESTKDLQKCSVQDFINAIRAEIDTDTNTIPTSIDFNPASGTLTLTLSDGSSVVDSFTLPDIFALAGNYIPDINGNVTIPLSDGSGNIVISGVVSPDDNDITSFGVVNNGDGQFTVTPTLSDGSNLNPFTFGENTFVTGFALESNGCDVTTTRSDGVSFTVSLCGLISTMAQTVNADGSVTVTHVSGDNVITNFTIPSDVSGRVSALEAKCAALEACVQEIDDIT